MWYGVQAVEMFLVWRLESSEGFQRCDRMAAPLFKQGGEKVWGGPLWFLFGMGSACMREGRCGDLVTGIQVVVAYKNEGNNYTILRIDKQKGSRYILHRLLNSFLLVRFWCWAVSMFRHTILISSSHPSSSTFFSQSSSFPHVVPWVLVLLYIITVSETAQDV